MRLNRYFLLLCIAIITIDTSAQKPPASQSKTVQGMMEQYDADLGSLRRFYVIQNSPERRIRFEKLNTDYQEALQQLNFGKMPVGEQVDYILFNRNLDNQLHELGQEAEEYNALKKYFPFADSIYHLEKLRRRGTYLNSPQVAFTLNKIDHQVDSLTKLVSKGEEISKPLTMRASGIIKGLRDALKSVHKFYDGYDPSFTWWVESPYNRLDSSLGLYSNTFLKKTSQATTQKDDGSGIVGNPIGREELIRQLQSAMIPYTPEELVEIANKEFAWCDAEVLKASAEMGFGKDWKAALEKVKNTYVPVGHQPEMLMGLYNESVNFIKQHDLVTVPPLAEETWRMEMLSPRMQLIAPFFLGGETLLIAYPTNTMDEDDKMMSLRGNNPHFARAVLHHELIAGHRLQQYMNDRYKTYRDFNTPFWTEGWALYWEMILWDLKFPKSPEDKIGMLFWRMHRCARIIFSLNYHLGKWTPQQCIDFLVDRVGHEKANAAGEVRRSFTGGYGPLYQLAYMTGALQFYSLKTELVDSGKITFKQFHDAILHENNMPIEMVRAILINQPLKKDYKTSWRFYDLKNGKK